jgi:signal transduction histidine kinase
MAWHSISSGELRKATPAKTESMSRIYHDLRTPLNVIIGFAELMLDEVPGQINKEQRQCLNDILNSARRLLNLINDTLDPSNGGVATEKAQGKYRRHHGE